MKQYVIFAALGATLLTLAACGGNEPRRGAVVVKPRPVATHEIPTINTDNSANDAATVNYVTGGIGDDERAAIEAEKGSYNTHITNSSIKGAFVEDTNVIITNKAGVQVLNVTAGPLLYVQLPAGAYSVSSSHGGETKTKKLTIGAKTKAAPVSFGWAVPATIAD